MADAYEDLRPETVVPATPTTPGTVPQYPIPITGVTDLPARLTTAATRAALEDGLPTIQTFEFSAASAYASNETWTDPASGLTFEWQKQSRSVGSVTVLNWELLISGDTFGLPDGVHDPMIFEWAFTTEHVLVNPTATRVDAVGVDSNASAAAAIRAAVNGVGAGLALTAGAVVDATVPLSNNALGAYNAGITIGAAEGAMSKVDMAGGTAFTPTPDRIAVDISELTDAQSVAVAHRAVYNAEAGAHFVAAAPVAGLTTFTAKSVGAQNNVLFAGTGAGTATITQEGTTPIAALTVPIPQAGVVGLVKSLNAQTGTTYTLAASDSYEAGTSLVTLANADPITVTVPKNATVPIAVGQSFNLQQIGAGQVTFAPVDGDVTINPVATLKISAQWKAATLVKTATNVWSLIGSLSA